MSKMACLNYNRTILFRKVKWALVNVLFSELMSPHAYLERQAAKQSLQAMKAVPGLTV